MPTTASKASTTAEPVSTEAKSNAVAKTDRDRALMRIVGGDEPQRALAHLNRDELFWLLQQLESKSVLADMHPKDWRDATAFISSRLIQCLDHQYTKRSSTGDTGAYLESNPNGLDLGIGIGAQQRKENGQVNRAGVVVGLKLAGIPFGAVPVVKPKRDQAPA